MNANHPENIAAKAIAAHVRKRIKVAGIKAGVKKFFSCGSMWVQVSTATHDQDFTIEEQRQIKIIGEAIGMTGAAGHPIDINDPCGNEADFRVPSDHHAVVTTAI